MVQYRCWHPVIKIEFQAVGGESGRIPSLHRPFLDFFTPYLTWLDSFKFTFFWPSLTEYLGEYFQPGPYATWSQHCQENSQTQMGFSQCKEDPSLFFSFFNIHWLGSGRKASSIDGGKFAASGGVLVASVRRLQWGEADISTSQVHLILSSCFFNVSSRHIGAMIFRC